MRRFALLSISTALVGAAFACSSAPSEDTGESASDLTLCVIGKPCSLPIKNPLPVQCIPGAPNCSTPAPTPAPAPTVLPTPAPPPVPSCPPGQDTPYPYQYHQYSNGMLGRCDAPPAGETCAWIPNALCTPVIPDANPPVVKAVAMGAHTTYALGVPATPVSSADTRAAVYSWGLNADYELGNGTTTNASSAVVTLWVPGNPVTAIAAGDKSACALLADGSVQCWGTVATLPSAAVLKTPTPIAFPAGTSIGQIASGTDHTCALTKAGTAVYCWGNNDRGQLGDAKVSTGRAAPYKVPLVLGAGVTVTSLAAGGQATCALDTTGEISCWGDNSHGSLGTGFSILYPKSGWLASYTAVPQTVGRVTVSDPSSYVDAGVPLAYMGLSGGGAGTFCGHTSEGWFCWGANDVGQAAISVNGSEVIGDLVAPLPTISGTASATSLAIGTSHMCFGDSGGVVECVGVNDVGQLGRSTPSSPDYEGQGVVVSQLAPWNSGAFTAVAVGGKSSCAIVPRFTVASTTQLGTLDMVTQATFTNLACWGSNDSGQLSTPTLDFPTLGTPTTTKPIFTQWFAPSGNDCIGAGTGCL